MKFDASLLVHDLSRMPALARFADDAGFDGVWTFETAHEPFFPLVLAAEHSRHLTVGTSIAVAFARSPAILASIGWDLAQFSKGRFILGSPSECIEQIHEYKERLGISYMLPRFDWTPGLPQDEILASMRLFGEKVIQKL